MTITTTTSLDPLVREAFALAIVGARVAGLAWTAPAWNTTALGWRLRFSLAGALTLIVAPLVGPGLAAPSTVLSLAQSCAVELAIGAALGLGLGLLLAAACQAGELIGQQAGLSPAALLGGSDASTSGEATPLGHLYTLVALGAFLALDGPLRVLDALIATYRVIPPGAMRLDHRTVAMAFTRLDDALALALRAAAPVALAMILAGLTMGLLARATTGMQLLSLSLPVRWGLGVALSALGIAAAGAVFSQAWQDLFQAALLP